MEPLREQVAELAAIHRPSASDGERRAAEWVDGAACARTAPARGIETERAHGGYWGPLTLLSLAGALGALVGGRSRAGRRRARRRRGRGRVGRHHRRRAPRAPRCSRSTTRYNVVAEMGPADARRTVVLVAHHDAAKSGLIFHPAIPAFVWRRFPALIERNDTSPPLMLPVFAGPALAALGSARRQPGCADRGRRRLRAARRPCSAQIGSTRVVPGANDNGTGVVALLELARRLAERADRQRARAAGVHRLGGVVHGGHAGVHAPPRPLAAPATTRSSCGRHARLSAPDRDPGRGHART